VAGAGLACARFLAQRPVDRVDILRATVCLLLALPVIMNVLPAMDLALLPRCRRRPHRSGCRFDGRTSPAPPRRAPDLAAVRARSAVCG
jgi:hypothetical protein